jgi:uncharacterized metal-binding protein YceD (DUF177 family)
MNDFTVQLGSITNGKNYFSFEIKDQFFEAFTFSDVEHANISAVGILDKDGENISLNLIIDGEINQLACDICTDELSVKISAETDVIIKKTDKDLVSTDEIFYIKKSKNKLDLKHLIFELIVVNTPKKRQHPLDKRGNSTCNKEMIDLVNKYTQVRKKSSDSRWDALKSLK